MTRSLKELVNFLLDEISLRGDQGASPQDVVTFIDEYYAAQPNAKGPICRPDLIYGGHRQPNLDRKFQEKVWTWLTNHPEVSVGENRQGNGLSLNEAEATCDGCASQEVGAQRVFVTTERMWLAIAGHEPDISRILPLEFALLSIIAAQKRQGIVQGDLVRLSGQDKRSVPKRTDALSSKGYIEKKAIQFKSARTSLCTLRKFVSESSEAPGQTGDPNIIDFKAFLEKMFTIFRHCQIITRNDLKAQMDMLSARPAKILSRAIRKLERIGCLRRVRAASQYAHILNYKHSCIMLAREPTENDLRLFYEDSRSLVNFLRQEEDAEDNIDGEDELADVPPGLEQQIEPSMKDVEQEARIVPKWTPDRPLTNMIYDFVRQSGTNGMSNLQIVNVCTGPFFRRPLEAHISRICEQWQYAQPLHLRKFSIVRDSALRGTVSHYVHYTLNNYKTLVDNGQAYWEAIDVASKQKNAPKPVPIHATPKLDKFGFPVEKPDNLFKDGNASLRACVEAGKPVDDVLTPNDPRIVKVDGQWDIIFRVNQVGRPRKRPMTPPGTLASPAVTKQQPRINHKRKERDEVESFEVIEGADSSQPPRKQRKENDGVRRVCMSKKEAMEAKGLDESFTEYAVLVMERPGPGIYLTRLGKKRPVGKARGRPPKSRIAVIKSEKLRQFDWFLEAPERSFPEPSEEDEIEIRQSKRRSTRIKETAQPEPIIDETEAESEAETPRPASAATDIGSEEPAPMEVENEHPVSISENNARVPTEDHAEQGPVNGYVEDDDAMATKAPPERRSKDDAIETESPQETDARLRSAQPVELVSNEIEKKEAEKRSRRRVDLNRGSLGMVRRNIIFDILTKCNGMYPMSSELWYPFTTAWLRTRQTERPDMRTIKVVVKNLVDTGKVRQLTFSGRNSKRLIVTRSIITLPEIRATDQRVQDLQNAILAADPQMYFPPESDIDPSLRKSQRVSVLPPPSEKPTIDLPDMHVRLHHVPARLRGNPARGRLKTIRSRALRDFRPRDHSNVMTLSQLAQLAFMRDPVQTYYPQTRTFGVSFPHFFWPEEKETEQRPIRTAPLKLHEDMKNVVASAVTSLPSRRHKGVPEDIATRFHREVDAVQQWEDQSPYIYEFDLRGYEFINHTPSSPFVSVPLGGPVTFQHERKSKARNIRPSRLPKHLRRERGLRGAGLAGPDTSQRLLTQIQRQEYIGNQRGPSVPRPGRTDSARRYAFPRELTAAIDRKILVAIAIVRTLAGGMDGKQVDWRLMSLAFPALDSRMLYQRGRMLMNKHRLQMVKMQSDFQIRFLEAYENEQVPPINYNDLEAYDWPWIVEWAKDKVEVVQYEGQVPNLPATREQFDRIFDMRIEPRVNIDEIWHHTSSVTVPRRRHLFASVPFSIPLETFPKPPASEYLQKLRIAKSWVRANVVASNETYVPAEAAQALSQLGLSLLSDAKEALIRDRVIGHSNRGRLVPGRNYDVTDAWIQSFNRRFIDSLHLRRAAAFKTQLDATFSQSPYPSQASFTVPYTAEDGDMLALLNMAAAGRVRLAPVSPPSDKYGLTDGGYMTRLMDKRKLFFDVVVCPTEQYVYSNPLFSLASGHLPEDKRGTCLPPIPRAGVPDNFAAYAIRRHQEREQQMRQHRSPPELRTRIPIWIDIHGCLVSVLWNLAVSAVVACIAMRPRLSVRGVTAMLAPGFGDGDTWQVGEVLRWLVRAGAVKEVKVGVENSEEGSIEERGDLEEGFEEDEEERRYEVLEWWWLVLGNDIPPVRDMMINDLKFKVLNPWRVY